MNERAKLGLLCVLWLFMLMFVVFAAANVWQAAQDFQQQYTGAKAGDVKAIRPWMTIQMISRVYNVPEDYLCSSVQIKNTDPLRHETLYTVASRKQQPVDRLISTLQHAITMYRQKQKNVTRPMQSPWFSSMFPSPVPKEIAP